MHLQRQIDHLKKMILTLGGQVEESVRRALEAVTSRDPDLAEQVRRDDASVDQMEVEIEEECLHTLALHQPVAMDLRYIVAVLKINNDVERIGDLASNIAEQALLLSKVPKLEPALADLPEMAELVPQILKQSLDALVELDTQQAQRVREADDRIDQLHKQVYQLVEQRVRENPEHIGQLIHMLNISRQLERIADHACNIAEDVLYMQEGEIHRHEAIRSRGGA